VRAARRCDCAGAFTRRSGGASFVSRPKLKSRHRRLTDEADSDAAGKVQFDPLSALSDLPLSPAMPEAGGAMFGPDGNGSGLEAAPWKQVSYIYWSPMRLSCSGPIRQMLPGLTPGPSG